MLVPALPRAATHLRVHILPHGGVNRLRVFGDATDTAGEARALTALHALPGDECATRCARLRRARVRRRAWRRRCRSPRCGRCGLAGGEAFAPRGGGLLEAFAAHPRARRCRAGADAIARTAAWSRGEQAALGADAAVRERLRAGNEAYRRALRLHLPRVRLGPQGREVVEALEERLANDRDSEIANAAREQGHITRLRLGAGSRRTAPGEPRRNDGHQHAHSRHGTRGRPADGVDGDARAPRRRRGGGARRRHTDADGRVGALLAAAQPQVAGTYRLRFAVGAYFARLGVEAFFPSVEITFARRDPGQHHHVPLLLSPFGYSTYRGS